MTTAIYIASPEARNGRNATAFLMIRALRQAGKSIAVFRPVAAENDVLGMSLARFANPDHPKEAIASGVTPSRWMSDSDSCRSDIITAYREFLDSIAPRPDVCVIVGADGTSVFAPNAFGADCSIACDLHARLVLAICARHRDVREVEESVRNCRSVIRHTGGTIMDLVVTGCDDSRAPEFSTLAGHLSIPVQTIPPVAFDADDDRTRDEALRPYASRISVDDIAALLNAPAAVATTPHAFQNDLLVRASSDRKRIVLPEGMEDRVLKAADYLLRRNVVDITLIGDSSDILARSADLGLRSIESSTIIGINDPDYRDRMVERLCELRAHKGMTEDIARKTLTDRSYFGTMLVQMGLADGLVSGSVTSTASTVRPALQVIRTRPDASLVSGAFIMCLPDHPVVFADCAITTNPTASQLADIAIQTAGTARDFGIEPRVGMLSYSTLGSGCGPDVDLVTEATDIVSQRSPDLPLVGPIQFDAAWSPDVAHVKAPGNSVAGRVNVYVFPDLSAGNIAYKAVQRSSGALAIGPVLQGLNKPVNDLSRGASVKDIVNTIALTAVQAQC